MVVCYFGMVFNRSSQLDHGLVVGLPLCEAKRHHKSTILNRNFIQEKTINFQIVGLEAWDSVATRSEHKNLKQTTRYKLRGSWWFAILGWFSIDLHN